MKEQIFVYFIGTAGSGKSTLTSNFQQWMNLRGLDAITVNLDPGAENLPYDPDVDIRDWISLKEIMESYGLGPNGAQIACADMLALNTDDLKKSIGAFKADYVLMDTPGQLELFVFREAGKYLVKFLNPDRSIIAYLLDPALAKTASGFVSQLLLSVSTNFRLGYPQVNILSKADMLPDTELEQVERWSNNPDELESALINEKSSVYREMSEGLLTLIKDFESQGKIFPIGKEDFYGIEDLYTQIQFQFGASEDLMSD
ncbi:MAG: ATP/GTP-binding protein [Thermoplasmatales archaeon]|nr:ATP/GTP-binding protein [Thermoplasmatales archaeon]MCK4995290.1 ATP/GTP-binding protein [Thermoplasmatales archaeon]